jgi:hypothetical protein
MEMQSEPDVTDPSVGTRMSVAARICVLIVLAGAILALLAIFDFGFISPP